MPDVRISLISCLLFCCWIQVMFFACVQIWGQAWRLCMGKKQVIAWYPLSMQICGRSRCCGLSGQCLWEQWHTALFLSQTASVTSCKSLPTRRKPQRYFVNVETKTFRFYCSPRVFITATFTLLSLCGYESGAKMLFYISAVNFSF